MSSHEGYREIRQLVTRGKGVNALARAGAKLDEVRELRADQYGLRTRVRVLETEIKFEFVFEARIALERSGVDDRICGIATLTPTDMAATKLLANSDHWRDDAVHSRDLIDLAMMQPPRKALKAAREKARSAYGDSIDRDLSGAIERFAHGPEKLEECMRAL